MNATKVRDAYSQEDFDNKIRDSYNFYNDKTELKKRIKECERIISMSPNLQTYGNYFSKSLPCMKPDLTNPIQVNQLKVKAQNPYIWRCLQ